MRLLAPALALGLVLASLVARPERACAQSAEDGWAPPAAGSRPTSGEASFLSGRTLGTGQTLIAAGLGWPGLWAHLELAPDSSFNVGLRAGVSYGSPVMGLVAGAGGEVLAPMRLHLFGEGELDVALRITPQLAVGEGRLFGEAEGIRANALGISSRLDVGARVGWRAAERFTLFFGADAGAGFSWTDGERARPIGVFTGTIGVEALMSLETMLFAEVTGGAGIADGGGRAVAYYPQAEVFRLSLGLAYVL
jgi:hypothetical protein